MQDELRKLAQHLRTQADKLDQQKMVKCAQIIRGASGLALLKKKIGRK